MSAAARAGGSSARIRQHVPTTVVATLAASFGVLLLQVTGILAASIAGDDVMNGHPTVPIYLDIAAGVFIAIAIYVSAVVISNTVATVVAGRVREIALLRLIGSSAARERGRIAREGLLVGVIGAVAGGLVGTGIAAGLGTLASVYRVLPPFDYDYLYDGILVPMVAVVLTTWLAAWTGSHHVLRVRPVQALAAAAESDASDVAGRRRKHVGALVLFVIGVVMLAIGVVGGSFTPSAVLVAVVGGIVSFSGIVLAGDRVIPPVLRLIGRMLGSSRPARLAADNAVRHPERATRMTIGLVIGVTLVTTFAVTMKTFQSIVAAAQHAEPGLYEGIDPLLNGITAVFSTLIGFSALIAAIGLVNSLGLNVLQRTRELGLMRALGFAKEQLRAMILLEATALTATATIVGLLLGIGYGWAGAQSFLGAMSGAPGLVWPSIPWPMIGVIVAVAVVLTLIAAVAPSRRATRVSPVTALAVE